MERTWVKARNHPNYEVSNKGDIRRALNGKLLLQQNCDKDYKLVTIFTNGKKYTKRIAKLIWESFNECECKETIDHKDRNKSNNQIENLACISLSENCKNRHIYRNKNKYNLDDDKKRIIINKIAAGEWKSYTVWKEYKIPTNYIDSVVKRGTWNHLIDEPTAV
jgi:hypothetical protein